MSFKSVVDDEIRVDYSSRRDSSVDAGITPHSVPCGNPASLHLLWGHIRAVPRLW